MCAIVLLAQDLEMRFLGAKVVLTPRAAKRGAPALPLETKLTDESESESTVASRSERERGERERGFLSHFYQKRITLTHSRDVDVGGAGRRGLG